MARKLLASGLGERYPVDCMHLGMNPLGDDFYTDATEIFAGLSIRSLFVNTFFFRFNETTIEHLQDLVELKISDPVDWVSDRENGSKLPKPVLPLLEKLEISSSDLPGVMDLPLNVEMPRLHNLQLYVDRRAWRDRTILAEWVEVLFGGARSARLRKLKCNVLIDESDALQFLDALLQHLPRCTSLETVKFNISHLERLGDCIRAVGSNGAPCRSLKIKRGESDCKPEDLSRLWAILISSLKTDPWDHLEILHIDLTLECLELASEIPHLSTLLEAAKQSRAVEPPKGQYLPDTTPEEKALQQPLRQWIRDRMAEAGLKDACKDKEIGLRVVYRYM
ncbi:BZ3500_MvSof-1268-A1-R1_Chr3-2g06306 [Microbotryum saponariae]|uniref:BZ3500_MvSof-1268-A1-R1_Chr3-2g06306 protein n=1 Tax=Microbotryum saponariae TaxID=289078 RepID=A0A2X0L0L7_9BASI|nr:BZ3500_MvSof-1268-A1-R1_Chr3-2g06306 [Microbotryum saponariae]SDA04277.1 BZ3501_MvSof-1269-A2-R1_Chr3-2g05997 [Microbotryum saponariae]